MFVFFNILNISTSMLGKPTFIHMSTQVIKCVLITSDSLHLTMICCNIKCIHEIYLYILLDCLSHSEKAHHGYSIFLWFPCVWLNSCLYPLFTCSPYRAEYANSDFSLGPWNINNLSFL